MKNQSPQVVDKYEVLFAVRTGLTILLPKMGAFDSRDDGGCFFDIVDGNYNNVIINTPSAAVMLKGLQKSHIEASISRGFIMLYETEDDEVVRNTVCSYKK